MAYVDPTDKILKWENGDVVTPLAAKMNMHLDSVGGVTNALVREGTYRVNNIPERTALVNTIGVTNISNANPLMVWRANAPAGQRLEYTENGGTWHYVKTSQDTTGWINIDYVSEEFSSQTANQLRYKVDNSIVYIEGGAYRVPANFVRGLYTEVAVLPSSIRKTGPTIRSGAAGQGGRPALWEMSGGGSIKLATNESTTRWIAVNFSYPLP